MKFYFSNFTSQVSFSCIFVNETKRRKPDVVRDMLNYHSFFHQEVKVIPVDSVFLCRGCFR